MEYSNHENNLTAVKHVMTKATDESDASLSLLAGHHKHARSDIEQVKKIIGDKNEPICQCRHDRS